ncbi:MAG: hypothetical protein PUF72_10385 [Clostridiales bacterium]|nr:hypothetical protein [Clostridiales bacterium]
MVDFFRKINKWIESNMILLAFTRLVETFAVSIIPGFLTVWVLARKPIYMLMYALFGVSMLVALIANIVFWYQFMRVMRNWKKYLIMNLGTYLLFAVVTIVWYFAITAGPSNAGDTLFYTRLFAGLRALEFFNAKTIYSIIILHVISIGACLLTGKISFSNAKKREEEYFKSEEEEYAEI